MQKKISIFVCLCIIVCFVCTGCGHADTLGVSEDETKYYDPVQITGDIYVDNTTGVLYYDCGQFGSYPLYNADGTPKNISQYKDDESLLESDITEYTSKGKWVANTPRIGNVVTENDRWSGPGYYFSNTPDGYGNAYVENKTLHYDLNHSNETVDKKTELLADDFHFYVEFCDYTCRQGGDYCDVTYMEVSLEDGLKLINEQPTYGGEMTHIAFTWADKDNELIDAGNPDDDYDDIYDYKYLSSITLVWHLNSDWS